MHHHASIRSRRRTGKASLALTLGACLCAGQLVAAPAATAAPAAAAAPVAAAAPSLSVAPRMQVTPNARTVAWGRNVSLLARFSDPRTGQPVRGGTATLQVHAGSRWSNGKTIRLDHRGEARYAHRVVATTTYRVVFNGLAPVYKAGPSPTVKVAVRDRAAQVISEARRLSGKPYRYGAAGPNAFDCSGLTQYVFRRTVGRTLPHDANAQQRYGQAVSKSQKRPGDLLVFLDGNRGYHVAIYAGGNYMYDAPRPGQTVGKRTIWSNRYVVRRLAV
ncbi:NlpC/P60 family protein [Micromonospora pattaloongensis]|uniref:NlpC/P60 family protein n=1 Tax=Micromonospora pattaloongensis TaxID=405436 RepID=A0A1H3Q2Z0_9ACTN|nr:C40 family peptidase [Micromonospora pattaloongensis]SDZ07541.1 NlpC/P60 family protein [Micromonospora pattaloongensis]